MRALGARIALMVMCDYFSAPDDDAALSVLDHPGGPDPAAWDVLSLKGIDPVIAMAELEAILTGSTYEETSELPRSGQLLSSPEAESAFIVSVSDTLQEALAEAEHSALAGVAAEWANTEELRDDGVTADIALEVLVLLSGLASRARSKNFRLFCWWAL
ncbi:hypothetical protein [Nocardia sp. NPDC057030]|uniref:hypothetical protein n=1 Tax=unclassified Nocardia TaxID=2637762 RepID=UPI00363C50B8